VCDYANAQNHLVLDVPPYSYKYFITGGVQDIGHLEMVYCHIMNLPYTIGESPRLVVREEIPSDLTKIYEIYEDEDCKRFLEPIPPVSDISGCGFEEAERFKSVKDSYMLLGYGMWVVEEKATGKVIGRAGFEYFDDSTVSLGFVIAKSERKKGYAHEACLLCLDYLFNSNPDLSVVAKYSSENEASKALLSKLSKTSPVRINLIEES